jgi:hypothetical protein
MAVAIVGYSRLKLRLGRLEKFLTDPGIFEEIGAFIKESISLRTAEGEGIEGPFQPYSKSYAKVRLKKGLPIDKVDLFFTGSMMGAMTYDAEPKEVRVFFLPTYDRKGVSNAAKALYNDERRNFFALTRDEAKEIGNMVRKSLRESIQGT